jgi:isoprenylcysteine carboxyl methyltransferase (ICMT) family protein YpbQ
MSYLVGPNELSIRDASIIHAVLGQGGLPKGPRKYKVLAPQHVAYHVSCFITRLGRCARAAITH